MGKNFLLLWTQIIDKDESHSRKTKSFQKTLKRGVLAKKDYRCQSGLQQNERAKHTHFSSVDKKFPFSPWKRNGDLQSSDHWQTSRKARHHKWLSLLFFIGVTRRKIRTLNCMIIQNFTIFLLSHASSYLFHNSTFISKSLPLSIYWSRNWNCRAIH